MTPPPHVFRGPPARAADPAGDLPVEKRVYFEVFGCQMNKLDAELMLGVLLESGYALTEDIDRAGVILYNTCAVRQHAVDRVFSRIGLLRLRKRRQPGLVIGLLGCVAQHEGGEILRRFPQIDIVCGTGEFLRLPELIETARRDGPVLAVSLERDVKIERKRNLGPHQAQAFVSVMRGCDQACTFCVVPATRGKEMSRPVAEVVEEVKRLVGEGVCEVTLLGQTVNSYGKRLAPNRKIGLHHLLHELQKVRGLERIRFITSHPRFMSGELIDAMADLEKVCPYLHLPVQSGSDAVLRRMLRTYTIAHYREVVARCRARIPGLALATDLIVGFPGETGQEFAETFRLMEEIRFQGSFVFKYSERPGTRAAAVADDIPEEVKRERNQTLLDLQERISREVYRQRIGGVEEVLVEGPSRTDPGRFTGRNRAQQIVVFPGEASQDLEGKMVSVRITGATALTLIGERVAEPDGKKPRSLSRLVGLEELAGRLPSVKRPIEV
jgi:tRNA-2-methylthio-N6-dimethylallyladenosine synthase